MEKKYETEVTQDEIWGDKREGDFLYMIVWQRLANSGITYVWAKDEVDALNHMGYNPKFVKHTVVRIDPENMPVVSGVEE